MSGMAGAWPAYKALRYRAFSWRHELPVAAKVALALGMAGATGALAQVRVQLPFTEVPVTGQTLGVLLSAVLLGKFYGGLSQALYVGLGAGGLHWFAGLTGGPAVLVGVTGGYLIGFVLAAGVVGSVSERYVCARRFWPQLALMLFGSGLILSCGALQYSLVMRTGAGVTLLRAVLPFLPGDIAKAVLAAGVSTALLPKGSYNGEVDASRYSGRL